MSETFLALNAVLLTAKDKECAITILQLATGETDESRFAIGFEQILNFQAPENGVLKFPQPICRLLSVSIVLCKEFLFTTRMTQDLPCRDRIVFIV